MDRILSARIDDAVYRKISDLSHKLHTSKKAVIEKAVELLGYNCQEQGARDVFDETCGAWQRDETPAETSGKIRNRFNASLTRHQK